MNATSQTLRTSVPRLPGAIFSAVINIDECELRTMLSMSKVFCDLVN